MNSNTLIPRGWNLQRFPHGLGLFADGKIVTERHIIRIIQGEGVQVIRDRRHPALLARDLVDRMIDDNYRGSFKFMRGGYLWRYPRESLRSFDARRKRAVPWLHIRDLADVLGGLLYASAVERKFPSELEFMFERTSQSMGLNSFMQTLAIKSSMHTVGLLIDSPEFTSEQVKTKADETALNLNPFAVMYMPWQIRDFEFDDNGQLQWVMVDNSRTISDNPEKARTALREYRLWEPTKITDYVFRFAKGAHGQHGHGHHGQHGAAGSEASQKEEIEVSERENPTGMIPFRFVNWRDNDEDGLNDGGPFDDAALNDQKIYNFLSYLDETLASVGFKILFYPIKNEDDVPDDILEEGVSGLSVALFRGELSNKPFFEGPSVTDVEPFLKAIQEHIKQIYQRFGMDKDQEKAYVQSGVAKAMEFRKAEALLTRAATNMEETEVWMAKTMARWRGKEVEATATYTKSFKSDEVDTRLSRLQMAADMQFQEVKKSAVRRIIKLQFPDATEEELTRMVNDAIKRIDSEFETKDETKPADENAAVDNALESGEMDSTDEADDENTGEK